MIDENGVEVSLPGHALPVTVEDQLVVRLFHLNSATNFNINWQLRLPDGRLQWCSHLITPTTDGLLHQTVIPVGVGYLINLSVTPSGSYNEYTETYCKVLLWRGTTTLNNPAIPLIDNYVSGYGILGWPFSRQTKGPAERGGIVHINVTSPAAGADFSYNFGVYVGFELEYVKLIFTTAAAVADRQMILRFSDAAINRHAYFPCSIVQAASLAHTYTFSVGDVAESLIDTYHNRSIARGLFGGDAGGQLGTFITNKQAADQLSSIWLTGRRSYID